MHGASSAYCFFQNQSIKITSAAGTRELLLVWSSVELDAILLYLNFPSQDIMIFVKLLGKLTVLASEEAFIINLAHGGGNTNLCLESPQEAQNFLSGQTPASGLWLNKPRFQIYLLVNKVKFCCCC